MKLTDQIKMLSEPLSFAEINTNANLETLENEYWGPPTFSSYVVTTCHEMRKVPLRQLTAEHLRLVIGQKFSLPYLVPLAVERLRGNPLLDVKFYDGDLLRNLLSLPDEYCEWDRASTLSIISLATEAETILKSRDESDLHKTDIEIMKLATNFRDKYSKF